MLLTAIMEKGRRRKAPRQPRPVLRVVLDEAVAQRIETLAKTESRSISNQISVLIAEAFAQRDRTATPRAA
ncbi:MAG: hypothetical protein JO145_01885 [Acidobacteriaceae bacterium]|nr:hypothetical protein [Acidobacteriaceae bacterium]